MTDGISQPIKKTSKPLISVQNVARTFTKESNDAVVRDVSFVIPDGSFTIVYGASGSGKSTLLNCLAGLDNPTEGRVLYEDQDMYKMTPNERAYFRAHTMGMVHQTNHWVHSLSVVENVALPLMFLGFSKADAQKSALDSLRRVHMEQYANRRIFELSGGEQQRIAMARATVNNPAYIIADEPTGNLDSSRGDDIIDLLRYFNKELQRTIILVTHNLSYLPVADYLIETKDGHANPIPAHDLQRIIGRIYQETNQRMQRWKGSK